MTAPAPCSRPVPLLRSAFHTFYPLSTRWMDVDVYGHVNNVQYLSFFDTAVNGWMIEQGVLEPRGGSEVFLVVETGCHYFSELVFPEKIDAGISIERIGSSSVVYTVALFRKGDDKAAAQGRFVHVLVNRDTRTPTAIGPQLLKTLQTLEIN